MVMRIEDPHEFRKLSSFEANNLKAVTDDSNG